MIAQVHISNIHLFTHGLTPGQTKEIEKRIDQQLTKYPPITAVYVLVFDADSIAYENKPDIFIQLDPPHFSHTAHMNLIDTLTSTVREIITAVARGDSSDGYPAEWPQRALEIKDDANWECENCGHLHDPSAGRTLTVHHINMVKSDLSYQNLVALCQACHLRIQQTFNPHQTTFLPLPQWASKRGLGHSTAVEKEHA